MFIGRDITHAEICNFNDTIHGYRLVTHVDDGDPFGEVCIILLKDRVNSPGDFIPTDHLKSMEELYIYVNQLVRKEKIEKIKKNK